MTQSANVEANPVAGSSGEAGRKPLLRVDALQKQFGATTVLRSVSFDLAEGECIALLGPSGCGKTTTLRCVAGLEQPDAGQILLEDRLLNGNGKSVAPQERQMGLVFQSYSVWPHLTVYENVAFGLKLRGVKAAAIRERVGGILDLMDIGPLAQRRSWQLSGGQLQRVALARTLVVEPRLVLFDEPLSNLDAKLRLYMRVEIRSLLKRLGMSAVYVTHDQSEASVVADRIAVMNGGRIEQLGSWADLYHAPVSRFVADFMGAGNLLEATVVADMGDGVRVEAGGGLPQWTVAQRSGPPAKPGQRVQLCVPREAVTLLAAGAGACRGTVAGVLPGPGVFELLISLDGDRTLSTMRLAGSAVPAEGEACGLDIDESRIRMLADTVE